MAGLIYLCIILFNCPRSTHSLGFDTELEMTTYITTSSKYAVRHIEPDLYLQGNLLFSDLETLSTTDGRNTSAVTFAYQARVYAITGFTQITKTEIVFIDVNNHCLKHFDRTTKTASHFMGNCTVYGTRDGTTEALFCYPTNIIQDKLDPFVLYVTDFNNGAIRMVINTSIMPRRVITIAQRSYHHYEGIVQDTIKKCLYIGHARGLDKYNQITGELTFLAGIRFMDQTPVITTISVSALSGIALSEDETIIAAGMFNDKMLVISPAANTSFLLCAWDKRDTNSHTTSCEFEDPASVLIFHDVLYIGEKGRIIAIKGVGEEQPLTSTIPSTITDEGRTIQITTLLNVVLNNSTEEDINKENTSLGILLPHISTSQRTTSLSTSGDRLSLQKIVLISCVAVLSLIVVVLVSRNILRAHLSGIDNTKRMNRNIMEEETEIQTQETTVLSENPSQTSVHINEPQQICISSSLNNQANTAEYMSLKHDHAEAHVYATIRANKNHIE